jgi:hypothetical protein
MSGKWEGSVLTTEPPPLVPRSPTAQAVSRDAAAGEPSGTGGASGARDPALAAATGGALKAGRRTLNPTQRPVLIE